jgi:hypothetical protein
MMGVMMNAKGKSRTKLKRHLKKAHAAVEQILELAEERNDVTTRHDTSHVNVTSAGESRGSR